MKDFIQFVASILDVSSTEIDENTAYGDLEKWDSLMHMRLVMEIEDEYNIEIPIDEVPNIKTIKDLYGYVER